MFQGIALGVCGIIIILTIMKIRNHNKNRELSDKLNIARWLVLLVTMNIVLGGDITFAFIAVAIVAYSYYAWRRGI